MTVRGHSRRLTGAGAVALALALALAAGAGAWVGAGPQLVVEAGAGSRVLHREGVMAGATFRLEYVHSSERVAVRGTFRVEPAGALAVVETAFGGFGPGLPELAPGDDWRIADGLIVHRPRQLTMAELRLRVSEMARPLLTTPSGAALDLAALAGHGAPVTVRILPAPPPS